MKDSELEGLDDRKDGADFWQGQIFVFPLQHPDQPRGTSSHLTNRFLVSFMVVRRLETEADHLCLVLKLKMHRAFLMKHTERRKNGHAKIPLL